MDNGSIFHLFIHINTSSLNLIFNKLWDERNCFYYLCWWLSFIFLRLTTEVMMIGIEISFVDRLNPNWGQSWRRARNNWNVLMTLNKNKRTKYILSGKLHKLNSRLSTIWHVTKRDYSVMLRQLYWIKFFSCISMAVASRNWLSLHHLSVRNIQTYFQVILTKLWKVMWELCFSSGCL